ncbi:proline-rich protein 2-like [Homarus americanus]|uniref:proline-rich protein 2-like n=1 Tax=Homarus americanus TaxID=6706 RepID=UPI001C46CC90|nr:proline-rich protein 2-like [Homarus americanus]
MGDTIPGRALGELPPPPLEGPVGTPPPLGRGPCEITASQAGPPRGTTGPGRPLWSPLSRKAGIVDTRAPIRAPGDATASGMVPGRVPPLAGPQRASWEGAPCGLPTTPGRGPIGRRRPCEGPLGLHRPDRDFGGRTTSDRTLKRPCFWEGPWGHHHSNCAHGISRWAPPPLGGLLETIPPLAEPLGAPLFLGGS